MFGWNPLLWLLPCNLCRGGGGGLRYEVNVSYDLQRRCWADGSSSEDAAQRPRQTVRRTGRDKERECSMWKERDRERERDYKRKTERGSGTHRESTQVGVAFQTSDSFIPSLINQPSSCVSSVFVFIFCLRLLLRLLLPQVRSPGDGWQVAATLATGERFPNPRTPSESNRGGGGTAGYGLGAGGPVLGGRVATSSTPLLS